MSINLNAALSIRCDYRSAGIIVPLEAQEKERGREASPNEQGVYPIASLKLRTGQDCSKVFLG